MLCWVVQAQSETQVTHTRINEHLGDLVRMRMLSLSGAPEEREESLQVRGGQWPTTHSPSDILAVSHTDVTQSGTTDKGNTAKCLVSLGEDF